MDEDTIYSRLIQARYFVRHIENHLKNMPEVKDKRVFCKICNKPIDEIWVEEFFKTLKTVPKKDVKK